MLPLMSVYQYNKERLDTNIYSQKTHENWICNNEMKTGMIPLTSNKTVDTNCWVGNDAELATTL